MSASPFPHPVFKLSDGLAFLGILVGSLVLAAITGFLTGLILALGYGTDVGQAMRGWPGQATILFIALASVIYFGGLSAIFGWRRHLNLAALGFVSSRPIWLGSAAIMAAAFFYLDGLAWEWLELDPDGSITKEVLSGIIVTPESWGWMLLLGATIGPAVAAAEELFFRGLVYRWLRERMTLAPALLLGGLVFAIPHFYFLVPGGLVGIFMTGEIVILGALAAYLFERSGSLWPPILLHALNNLLVLATGIALLTGTGG